MSADGDLMRTAEALVEQLQDRLQVIEDCEDAVEEYDLLTEALDDLCDGWAQARADRRVRLFGSP